MYLARALRMASSCFVGLFCLSNMYSYFLLEVLEPAEALWGGGGGGGSVVGVAILTMATWSGLTPLNMQMAGVLLPVSVLGGRQGRPRDGATVASKIVPKYKAAEAEGCELQDKRVGAIRNGADGGT